MPSLFPHRFAPFLAVALLGTLACVDEEDVDGLYVFDGNSRTVQVWASPEELLAAAGSGKASPRPERTLRSGELAGITLAWGGMTLDTSRKRLYLVTEQGTVFVILQASTQKGDLSAKNDIISFKLKRSSGDEVPGQATFGQASVDPATDVLYVVENGRDAGRIWHVPEVSRVADGATVASQGHTSRAGEDRGGIGVAAGSNHQVYALFAGGGRTNDGFGHGTDGPRLRQGEHKGSHPAFQDRTGNRDHHLLAGEATLLPPSLASGSLAYSGTHHCVYVLANPQGDREPARILVFNDSQFHGSLDQAPARQLGNLPDDLRILAHAANADWLAGAGTGRPRTRDRNPGGDTDRDRGPGRDRRQDRYRDPGRDRFRDRYRDPDRGRGRFRDRYQDPDREGGPDLDRERDPDRRREAARAMVAVRDPGGADLYLWKGPNDGGQPVKVAPLAPGLAIRGLAFGGS